MRGADLFIVQSCAGVGKVNAYLWELLEMINAAKLASVKRVTAVMPWFPYSRQDKKSAPREPISARLLADTLEKAAGVDRVLTMDLHTGQIQGFFTIPVDHMTALPLFAQYFRDKGLSGEDVVSVSPDAGRAKLARRFGQMLEADLAIMNKTRPAHDQASITEVIGDVEGKIALMGDDMILTGGTLLAGAKALREAGAKEVYVFATHGHFVGDALEKLATDDLGRDRRHRHGAAGPARAAGQADRAAGLGAPGRHDHERLRRRIRVGGLPGRESALLIVRKSCGLSAGWDRWSRLAASSSTALRRMSQTSLCTRTRRLPA